MARKKWIWMAAVLIVIAGFTLFNILSNQKKPIKRHQPPPRRVVPEIMVVKNRTIDAPVAVSGYLYAYDKIELYAEVSGVLLRTDKPFREGVTFQTGETLIHIDDRVYRNNLLAQKSSLLNQLTLLLPDLSIDFPGSAQAWQEYLNRFDIQSVLAPLPEPASQKEGYYIAARDIYNRFYSIKGMEETLAKYTLEAPMNGVVTQSEINPGTLVRAGQKLGEFTNTSLYELEAAVGLGELDRVQVGQPVHFTWEAREQPLVGRIQRINRVVDRSSMTVPVYIHLAHPGLREGMYLTGNTADTPVHQVFPLPRRLLVAGKFVYAVEKSSLVRIPLDIVSEQGDTVIVRGLADGTRILAEVIPGAREGMTVATTKSAEPDPSSRTASPAQRQEGVDR